MVEVHNGKLHSSKNEQLKTTFNYMDESLKHDVLQKNPDKREQHLIPFIQKYRKAKLINAVRSQNSRHLWQTREPKLTRRSTRKGSGMQGTLQFVKTHHSVNLSMCTLLYTISYISLIP